MKGAGTREQMTYIVQSAGVAEPNIAQSTRRMIRTLKEMLRHILEVNKHAARLAAHTWVGHPLMLQARSAINIRSSNKEKSIYGTYHSESCSLSEFSFAL